MSRRRDVRRAVGGLFVAGRRGIVRPVDVLIDGRDDIASVSRGDEWATVLALTSGGTTRRISTAAADAAAGSIVSST